MRTRSWVGFRKISRPLHGSCPFHTRTLNTNAVLPQLWDSLGIYFLAPPLEMLTVAAVYLRLKHAVACAKLHHQNKKRCIFCEYQSG